MTEIPLEAIQGWCVENLTEKAIRQMEEDPDRVVGLYRDFTGRGWLETLDIFGAPESFRGLIEMGKIVSARSSAISNIIGVNCVCASILAAFGDEPQKELGRRVLKGEILTSFSMTEPEAGSDILNIQTTAAPTDGGWVLSGHKFLATGAAVADYILVAARTDPEKPLNKAISLLLVPTGPAGISISSQEKIATNGFASCEIVFDSVELPADAAIGGADSAWGILTFAGAVERLMVAASCVGLSQRMLEYIHGYTQKRLVGGSPLYDIQLINHQLADMAVKIQAADLLLKNAVDLLVSGAAPTVEICGAKVFASEMQQEVSMAAMRILGGRGYLTEYPVERWMREGLLALYAGGTNELQKNIIARKLRADSYAKM